MASVRSSTTRAMWASLRSAYWRTRSGTSTFLPLTIVRTRHLPGVECPRPSIVPPRRRARPGTPSQPRRRVTAREPPSAPTPRSLRPRAGHSRTPPGSLRWSARRRRARPSGPRRSRASAGDASAKAPATLTALARRSSSNWATVACHRRSAGRIGSPRPPRGHAGEQDGLVVASGRRPVAMDGHRDDEVAAGTRPGPASRHRRAEGHGQAPLARVLQRVERIAHEPGIRRAPLHLQQWRGQVGGKADRGPARQVQPRVERRRARGADRIAFPATADADGRKRQVEDTGRQSAESGHAGMVAGAASRPRIGRLRAADTAVHARLSRSPQAPARSGRRRPCRSGRSHRRAAPARRARRVRAARGRSTRRGPDAPR